ncbi:MAG: TRAP transporter small permease [Burkholderiales bacterium]
MTGIIYRKFVLALGWLAAFLLGIVALLVTAEVVARNTGIGDIPWVVEVSEYSLSLATFLVAPLLLHKNEHVRIDVFVPMLPRTVARNIERLTDLIGFLISAVFSLYGLKLVFDSMNVHAMVVKNLAIPEWWQYVPVVLCFFLLGIEFARRVVVKRPA